MFYVYAITNEKGKIYIGQTENIEKRIQRHNGILKNKQKSYSHKQGKHWTLFYQEEFQTRDEAIKRERQLKSYQGRLFIKTKIIPCVVSSVGRATAS